MAMKPFEQGLRCQDVHAGLRGIDPNSPGLGRLDDTRMVGMAATLASAIRGQDIIRDGQTLKLVAAEQLDIDPLAFPGVIDLLAAAEFVHSVQRSGGKVNQFVESIPLHEDLYATLGQVWSDRQPTSLEQQMLATVHRLAAGPLPAEDLVDAIGLDSNEAPEILQLARDADLVKSITTVDGEVLYSPFMGFEHPDAIGPVLAEHGPQQFQDEFGALRSYQGLPLSATDHPALLDAVNRGLIAAPAVERPDHQLQIFACLPYALDPSLFGVRKVVLDKAEAILACVRCGQHFGGVTRITRPLAILGALLDPDRNHALRAHSSAQRQYQPLYRMQIVDFVPAGNWVSPKLIETEDNIAAVRLARELIAFGEPMDNRTVGEADTRLLLLDGSHYVPPIQTVQRRRSVHLSDRQFSNAMDVLMGRSAL